MKHRIVIAALAVGLAASASAEKQPISLDCTTSSGDATGLRLCTELRDLIAASPRYREVSHGAKEFHWALHVISLAVDGAPGLSAQAVVFTADSADGLGYYLSGYVYTTGQSRVKDQAQTILAEIDGDVNTATKSAGVAQ